MAEGPFERLDRRLVPGLLRRPDVALLLVGALFLAAGGTHFWLRAQAAQTVTREVVTVGPGAPELGSDEDDEDGEGTLVGPVRGADVDTYVATRREYLASIAAAEPASPVVGVASFDRYLRPDELAALLESPELRGLAARYRLPVGDPFEEEGIDRLTRGRVGLTEDPVAALTAVLQAEAEEARRQAEDLDTMMSSADDEEFAQSFRRDRNRLLAAAALVGDAGCACIYAIELQGRAAELQELAQRSDVRLVDIAPPDRARGTVTFSALLPEERTEAGGP